MLALLMGLAVAAAPALQPADAVVGRWKTPVHNGIVEITRCGASICGKIYNAEDGKTYSAEITMTGNDQLNLRGCVFKPFCRTQTWTRVR